MIEPRSLINGRYRVGRRLGEGGMAIVYLGHDLLLGRDVAIKTLRPQFAADPACRNRFEREARAAASLTHPNIVDVYDVGDNDGAPYIVMELAPGQTLRAIIAADAPFHPDDVAELLEQIGGALDYAHSRGYVHRDVKPGNILIDAHGRARVVDFGIAKGLGDSDLTEHGGGFGTAAYLSPEQAAGLMASPASDVYSAGIVAYEMLTGHLPFQAESPLGLVMRHVHEPAPRPSSMSPGLPAQVDAVVLKALDKDPTRRWSSMLEFARAMRNWQTAPPRPALSRPLDKPAARGSLAPTIVIVLLIAGALAALLWTGLRDSPSTRHAEAEPTLLAPEPVVSGGLAEEQAVEPEEPAVVAPPVEVPAIVPQVGAETRLMPTIAPSGGAPATSGEVRVPNLVGLTISGATQALGPLGLRLVPGQPVFSDSIPFNAVAEQDPPPGTWSGQGQGVRVALSRGASPFAADTP